MPSRPPNAFGDRLMTARLKHRRGFWIGAVALAAGLVGTAAPNRPAAPGEEPAAAPAARTFIGELTGAPESARVGFVVEGNTFVAYVCSADQAFNDTFSRWFRGEVRDGKLSARGAGGAEVT